MFATQIIRKFVLFGLFTIAGLSCGDESGSGAETAVVARSLAGPGADANRRILGFEEASAWTSQSGTLALSTTRTQGLHALEFTPNGYTELVSAPLSSFGVGPVRTVSVDVRTPAPPVSPWFFGEAQLYVTIPSLNVDRYLGRHDFAELTPGQFGTFTFQVPPELEGVIGGAFTDLRFRLALITPAGSRAYLFDNMRLNGRSIDPPVITVCPPFTRVLLNGDLRFELVTTSRRSFVLLVVRRNGAETRHRLETSQVELVGGTLVYSRDVPASELAAGDSIELRFQSIDAAGRQFLAPGPTADRFTPAFSYDPAMRCAPVRDTDVDGKPDGVDPCPNDPNKTDPGFCNCGNPETDGDGDGIPDCVDECPNDAARSTRGDCGCAGALSPAGTVCVDGPCNARQTCNGQGVCGSPAPCILPGTRAPIVFRWRSSIYWLVPVTTNAWAEVDGGAPAGYRRLDVGDDLENRVLQGRIRRHLGTSARVWTSGMVTAPGVIQSFRRAAEAGVEIWNERAAVKNVGHAFLNFVPGVPQPGVASGCVSLGADGLWRIESCSDRRFVIYERSALSLLPRRDPVPVTCADFPGVICLPQDTQPGESCVQEVGTLPGPNEAEARAAQGEVDECIACQAMGVMDCSGQCTGIASLPPDKETCKDERSPASFCRVTNPVPGTCETNADCKEPGHVCGVFSDFSALPACTTIGGCPETERRCGAPVADQIPEGAECVANGKCDVLSPDCKPQDANQRSCSDIRVCTVLQPEGDPTPRPAGGGDLGPKQFAPADHFEPEPEPTPEVFPPDPADPSKPGKEHNWCHFVPKALAPQNAVNNQKGKGGEGSFVKLDFDPNISLDFDMKPLAQGEIDMRLDAQARFTASADYALPNTSGTIRIVDALVSAKADRCRFSTMESKLDIFGRDFLPTLAPGLRFDSADPTTAAFPAYVKCKDGLEGFKEVANRAKKAMRDLQELLRQYHQGLKAGRCFDPIKLCNELLQNAPEGFPKLDCNLSGRTVEDVINLFNFYYERQLDFNTPPFPDVFSIEVPTFELPSDTNRPLPDFKLPNIKLPTPPRLPDIKAPPLPSLPDLSDAQNALASIAPARGQPLPFEGGCTNDGTRTKRRTLANVQFALGPIPMLLEIEGVLKYGIGGKVDFNLNPANIIATNDKKQVIAAVRASAEPCASAGIALFVGAGFSGFGLKAAAGVEGMVNLVTLSMPAHATAQLATAREKVDVLDPLVKRAGATPARFVAKELRGLWNGEIFPIYRYKFYLGYEYGARAVASEFLKGKLSATLTIKFWFFKKRWRTTLVNFQGSTGFDIPLIHGSDRNVAAFGDFPWGTLQMPEPFVKFRRLKHVPTELFGLRLPELLDRGLEIPLGGLKLPDLGRLDPGVFKLPDSRDLTLGDLTGMSLPSIDLPRVALALNIDLETLKGQLRSRGLDLGNLHFADLGQLGFGIGDFGNFELSEGNLRDLDLDLSDLVKLGIDLSGLRLQLPKPQCDLDLLRDQVEQFFYDRLCACKATFDGSARPEDYNRGQFRCFNDADCCDKSMRCSPSGVTGYHVCAQPCTTAGGRPTCTPP